MTYQSVSATNLESERVADQRSDGVNGWKIATAVLAFVAVLAVAATGLGGRKDNAPFVKVVPFPVEGHGHVEVTPFDGARMEVEAPVEGHGHACFDHGEFCLDYVDHCSFCQRPGVPCGFCEPCIVAAYGNRAQEYVEYYESGCHCGPSNIYKC